MRLRSRSSRGMRGPRIKDQMKSRPRILARYDNQPLVWGRPYNCRQASARSRLTTQTALRFDRRIPTANEKPPDDTGGFARRTSVVSRCLLQRHEHLNHPCALWQRLQCLPYHRAKHSIPSGSFHGVTRCGRSNQQITHLDRAVCCSHLARYDAHHSQRNFVFGHGLVHLAGGAEHPRLGGINTCDKGGIRLLCQSHSTVGGWVNHQQVSRRILCALSGDRHRLGEIGAAGLEAAVSKDAAGAIDPEDLRSRWCWSDSSIDDGSGKLINKHATYPIWARSDREHRDSVSGLAYGKPSHPNGEPTRGVSNAGKSNATG